LAGDATVRTCVKLLVIVCLASCGAAPAPVRDIHGVDVPVTNEPSCAGEHFALPPPHLERPVAIEYISRRDGGDPPPAFADAAVPFATYASNGSFVHGGWVVRGDLPRHDVPLSLPTGTSHVRIRFGLCAAVGTQDQPCPSPIWYAERLVAMDSEHAAPLRLLLPPGLSCTAGKPVLLDAR
jgi:hypothetical protein